MFKFSAKPFIYDRVCGFADGVCVGQWRKDRTVSGQVYGYAGSHPARLLWEHGRWRDVADEHIAEEGA